MSMPHPPIRKTPPVPKSRVSPPSRKTEETKTYTPSKSFSVCPANRSATGDRIVIYSQSGMGKTTLAALARTPVFFPLDDGSRKIVNPKTGEPLNLVTLEDGSPIATFSDLRDAINSKSVIDSGETFVLETITQTQVITEPFIFETVRKAERDKAVTNLEAYGYGKGYKHLVDHIRLILADLDRLIYMGKDVVLIAQQHVVTVKNTEGEDFLQDGPDLQHNNQNSVRDAVVAWADHILRIGYHGMVVAKKKAIGKNVRAVYLCPEVNFVAKSRTINMDEYPVVSFERPDDDSFWQILYESRKNPSAAAGNTH